MYKNTIPKHNVKMIFFFYRFLYRNDRNICTNKISINFFHCYYESIESINKFNFYTNEFISKNKFTITYKKNKINLPTTKSIKIQKCYKNMNMTYIVFLKSSKYEF